MKRKHQCTCEQSGGSLANIGPLLVNKRMSQRGGNFYPANSYNYVNNQYGHGVGSVFAALGRVLIPLVKQGFSVLKKRGLEAGLNVLQDVQQQKPIRDFIASKTNEVIDSLTNKGIEKLKKMSGSGHHKRRKIKKHIKAAKSVKKRLVGTLAAIRPVKKQRKKRKQKKNKSNDIFS